MPETSGPVDWETWLVLPTRLSRSSYTSLLTLVSSNPSSPIANGGGIQGDLVSCWEGNGDDSRAHGSKRATTSPAVCTRLLGSFSIMSAMISTNSSLTSELKRRGCQGVSSKCRRALSFVVPPGKGTLPLTA